MRGISTLGRGKGEVLMRAPKGGSRTWCLVSNNTRLPWGKGGGGRNYCSSLPNQIPKNVQRTILHLTILKKHPTSRVHPALSKQPIFIVRLEARERKKDRLGEGEIVTPTNWGHRQVRPHMNYPWNRHASHRKAYPGVERSRCLGPREGPRREVERGYMLTRLACKEDKPVSKLEFLASPP